MGLFRSTLLVSVKPHLAVQGISPVASCTEHVASSEALLTIQQRLSQ